jgi:osmotically-inducible protein OsmY
MVMEGVDTAQMVRDAIAWDGRLNEANLTVRFGNGVVTLSGVVTSDSQRAEAEDVARHIPGVTRVVNEILVVSVAGR